MIRDYEKVSKNSKNTVKRISVLLDRKSFEALNELIEKKHLKISDVVRLSIMHYYKQEMGDQTSSKNLEGYKQYLEDGSHIIIEIETLLSLLHESEDKISNNFWKKIEEDGYRHGTYYKSLGIGDIKKILKEKEVKNWFKLKIESDGQYLLSLPAPGVQNFLKHFLKGLSTAIGIRLEIKEIGALKLLIREIKN